MGSQKWGRCVVICSFIFCLAGILSAPVIFPEETVSRSERRHLAAKPELTFESLLDKSFMDDTEAYLLDHFPFREGLRRTKAYFAYGVLMQKENNGIYVADGYAAKLEYPLNEASVKRLADKMAALKRQYFPNQNTWYAIVPDKNYFLAEANGYPAMDYGRMESSLEQELDATGGGFRYIDIFSGLDIADYYRTDTHWRQERLLDTAACIADALGAGGNLNLREADFQAREIRDFYGVYYGQAALPMEPDTMVYLTSGVISAATVWNLEENISDGKAVMPGEPGAVLRPVYRTDKLEDGMSIDKYDVFAGGAAPLQVLKSPEASGDRRLVIFRDSYTSSLAPLLLEAYSEITLVDLRYISSSLLGEYVDFADADILFLYSISIVNNAGMLK